MTVKFYIIALIILLIVIVVFSLLTYKVTQQSFKQEIKLDELPPHTRDFSRE